MLNHTAMKFGLLLLLSFFYAKGFCQIVLIGTPENVFIPVI